MERSEQWRAQHLGLATVCAIVYHAVTGKIPDPRRAAEMDAALNDVAHALANAVPIYARESGVPRRVSPSFLTEGKFSRGAQVFICKTGEQLRGLTVQRHDMESAISSFRSARVGFGAHKAAEGRRSRPIHKFHAGELEQLADAYDDIHSRLRELGPLTKVRLPPAGDKTQRLDLLRRLDATGKLTIRITEGGNLSVRALLAHPIAGQNRYAVLLRRRAT